MLAYVDEFNPQHQRRVTWPVSTVVAQAYVDQLARSQGIEPQHAAALRTALNRAAQLRTGREGNAVAMLGELDRLATDLEAGAASAPVARDATRMRSLASQHESCHSAAAALRPLCY